MRQTFLFAMALLLGITLTGCSKDEAPKFTINMEQVGILVGDDYKITPSEKFVARSTNEAIATVSAEGVIHGVSAGDADIIFISVEDEQTQTCKVNVDWKCKYFADPILDFGASVEDIKKRETHTLRSESPKAKDPSQQGWNLSWDEQKKVYNDMSLLYKWDDNGINVSTWYMFNNDKLVSVFWRIEGPIDDPYDIKNKIVRQLTERYGEPTGYKEVSNFELWRWNASTQDNIRYEVYNFDYASITYLSIQ